MHRAAGPARLPRGKVKSVLRPLVLRVGQGELTFKVCLGSSCHVLLSVFCACALVHNNYVAGHLNAPLNRHFIGGAKLHLTGRVSM